MNTLFSAVHNRRLVAIRSSEQGIYYILYKNHLLQRYLFQFHGFFLATFSMWYILYFWKVQKYTESKDLLPIRVQTLLEHIWRFDLGYLSPTH